MTWSCKCGLVEAEVPETGNRVICYCQSCRGFVESLGCSDRLDAAGGNDLFQVAPENVRLTKGLEHLAWLRLTEKGPLRWYTRCCNTPMVNTLGSRALPFASFQVHDLAPKEALPAVRARVNRKGATAHVDGPKGSFYGIVFDLLAHAAKAHLTGRWRDNPFFDGAGHPIAKRQELT